MYIHGCAPERERLTAAVMRFVYEGDYLDKNSFENRDRKLWRSKKSPPLVLCSSRGQLMDFLDRPNSVNRELGTVTCHFGDCEQANCLHPGILSPFKEALLPRKRFKFLEYFQF
jgi:hypothetical protein